MSITDPDWAPTQHMGHALSSSPALGVDRHRRLATRRLNRAELEASLMDDQGEETSSSDDEAAELGAEETSTNDIDMSLVSDEIER